MPKIAQRRQLLIAGENITINPVNGGVAAFRIDARPLAVAVSP